MKPTHSGLWYDPDGFRVEVTYIDGNYIRLWDDEGMEEAQEGWLPVPTRDEWEAATAELKALRAEVEALKVRLAAVEGEKE